MSERNWTLYIADMRRFAETVREYTDGLDQTDFIADRRTYDAVLRNLELIGEAATHIPGAIRDRHPDIPWRMIVATRNRLIHGYLGLDDDIIWSLVIDELPGLIVKLGRIER
ncbi:MAG: DUF86 domain-containing protein [Gammaproteobacteria bacterium]